MPNQDQIKSILQLLLGAGGPLAALLISYGVPQDKINLWVNLLVAVLPMIIGAVWAILDRTHKNTIASAAAIPGVSEVVIKSDAKDGAAQAAADPTLTNVNKAS
jgi:hypothetical protein